MPAPIPLPAQLLPASISDRNVLPRLLQSLRRADRLRGCVAYWTLGTAAGGRLGQCVAELARLLDRPDSFVCVDLHSPTNVRRLGELSPRGEKNLWLHCRKVIVRGERQLSSHQMHAKMLLLDFGDGEAELWVGSHNFTEYALAGKNVEASLVLPCRPGSELYEQAAAYLEGVRAQRDPKTGAPYCTQFDPLLIADYEKLQGAAVSAVLEVPVFGRAGMDQLAGQTMLLLGDVPGDLAAGGLGTVRQSVVLVATDLATGREYLYRAVVQNAGDITSNPKSYEIGFSERLYAIRRPGTIPYLAGRPQPFTAAELRRFSYLANVEVGRPLPGASLQPLHAGSSARWVRQYVEVSETAPAADHFHSPRPAPTEAEREQAIYYRAELPDRRRGIELTAAQRPLAELVRAADPAALRSFYAAEFQERYFGQRSLPPGRVEALTPVRLPPRLADLRRGKLVRRMQLVE